MRLSENNDVFVLSLSFVNGGNEQVDCLYNCISWKRGSRFESASGYPVYSIHYSIVSERMRYVPAFALFAVLLGLAAADNWAVIIGGSNSYSNYRHQANIAHQYHQYLDYGVKPEHIIVFDYDDVANSNKNPFPGKLYNLPGDDAKDYYEGLVIDYREKEITKEALFNCLLGIEDGSGKKVLKSTSEDKVFINYYDHGAPNLIALIDDRVKKEELQEVLIKMHDKKMFSELVFYLEACDSATMMTDFPDDLNIYVVTSTDAAVSGWACFCPPEDMAHGKHIGACLSEEFGYAYMKDMDENGGADTFDEQFKYISDAMKKSKPKQWASTVFRNETLAAFFGVNKKIVRPSEVRATPSTFWDTRDNKLMSLASLLGRTDLSYELRQSVMMEYAEEAKIREVTDRLIHAVVARTVGEELFEEMMTPVERVKNMQCYYAAVEEMDRLVPQSDYELKYFTVLANLCDRTGMRRLPIMLVVCWKK